MSSFGADFDKVWPKSDSGLKLTDFSRSHLQMCENLEKPDTGVIDIQDFIRKSSQFPIEFGTNTCRVVNQPEDRYPAIKEQIASAYPVIHERVLGLYLDFLEHKCKYGNRVEQQIYPRLTLPKFVQRLLTNRCVSFVEEVDRFLLLSGVTGVGGFDLVGTDAEKSPLLLKHSLSYDEIKLSAFLSVSSHSEFLNDGNRMNAGQIETDKDKIETAGVVIGLIGGRFERPNVMEAQDIMITEQQNTMKNGYGQTDTHVPSNLKQDYRRLWNRFYETNDQLYEQVTQLESSRFYRMPNSTDYFDNLLMVRRYGISFDTLLLDAEARAVAAGRQAYVHVTGIGLGVWKAVNHQTELFLNTFAERIKTLLPQLCHVSVVHFSWFHVTECGELTDNGLFASDTHNTGGVRTFLSNRNPAEKLLPEFDNMLVIVSYAWDGNALPGNEFWMKMLTTTGDSSTACSTLISEVHNPYINTVAVCGENLHIATLDAGVMHIRDFASRILKSSAEKKEGKKEEKKKENKAENKEENKKVKMEENKEVQMEVKAEENKKIQMDVKAEENKEVQMEVKAEENKEVQMEVKAEENKEVQMGVKAEENKEVQIEVKEEEQKEEKKEEKTEENMKGTATSE